MSSRLVRHLPGRALHKNRETGLPVFVKGIVESVSRNSILVKTDSKEIGQKVDQGHIRLIGETYIYWCPRCQTTVWELEYPADKGCPHCRGMCEYIKAGDRVRLHYRGNTEVDPLTGMVNALKTWASWWGEKVV